MPNILRICNSHIKKEPALVGRTFYEADISISKAGEVQLTAQCGACVGIKGKPNAALTQYSSVTSILGAPIVVAEWRIDVRQRWFVGHDLPEHGERIGPQEGTTTLTLRTAEQELSIVWCGLILEGEDPSLAECLYYPSQDLSVLWKFWDEEPEQGGAGRKPNEPTL